MGFGIERAGAADDDPDVFFCETASAAFLAIFPTPRAEGDFAHIDGASAAHHGIEFRAELKHEILVAFGGERREVATRGCEFAVSSHRDVDGDEGKSGAGHKTSYCFRTLAARSGQRALPSR